ncbi:uncharacterized protein LOC134759884 [Pongo abelii]|uniref:uncharacterized protein LOC134759884 n=1 Tax=Pongo abelii TaxID=9601 RepID=UPI003003B8CA
MRKDGYPAQRLATSCKGQNIFWTCAGILPHSIWLKLLLHFLLGCDHSGSPTVHQSQHLKLSEVALLMPLLPSEWVLQPVLESMASGPEHLPFHPVPASHEEGALGVTLRKEITCKGGNRVTCDIYGPVTMKRQYEVLGEKTFFYLVFFKILMMDSHQG